MNLLTPVAKLMTTNLITVNPEDSLATVKELFDNNPIHHLPVVRFKKIVGMISKSDLLYFLHGFSQSKTDRAIEEARLRSWKAQDIMTTGVAKVESSEPVRTALEVFKVNRFHALPIVDNDELVGILTPYDIIKALSEEPIRLEDYKAE
ncbi:MAG: CBS domain-containing protein [Bacteroidetes bacterium]|nr:MAG: CBS domain-containing protein [Bacteroidota bacterium]